MRSYRLRAFGLVSAFAAPFLAQAHEIYVLPNDVYQEALALPAFSLWQIILQNPGQFILWACIAILVVALVFFFSISSVADRVFNPFLAKLSRYAPFIGRVTLGLSFFAATRFQALFGPELPLAGTFGEGSGIVAALLVAIGVMLIIGFYARIAALAALVLFSIEVSMHGIYMLTYINYVGGLVLLLILGTSTLAFHPEKDTEQRMSVWLFRLKKQIAPYAFLILRVAFGTSILYSALYAKVFNNNLILAVAYTYPQIIQLFGFEPHFLVLGAAIIEILVAVFFILGVEIRFTALLLLFWLSFSLWYFGEAVWPHIILIGTSIALIFHGYDAYSLGGRLLKRNGRNPVL